MASPDGGGTTLGGGTPDAGCRTPFRLNLITDHNIARRNRYTIGYKHALFRQPLYWQPLFRQSLSTANWVGSVHDFGGKQGDWNGSEVLELLKRKFTKTQRPDVIVRMTSCSSVVRQKVGLSLITS